MPIEIKELHIRVTVNAPQGSTASSPQAPPPASAGNNAGDIEAIVAECVEQVLQILQEKRER